MNKHFESSSLHTSINTPDSPEFKANNHQKLSKDLQVFYNLSQSKYESKHRKTGWEEIKEAVELLTKASLLATDKETLA